MCPGCSKLYKDDAWSVFSINFLPASFPPLIPKLRIAPGPLG